MDEEIKSWLNDNVNELLRRMGFDDVSLKISKESENVFSVSVFSESDSGRIIGREGTVIQSIALLVNKMLSRDFKGYRVRVDAEDYMKKREESFKEKVVEIARRAELLSEEHIIKNLNSYERRIAHLIIDDFEGVESRSEGEGEIKDVVIFPK